MYLNNVILFPICIENTRFLFRKIDIRHKHHYHITMHGFSYTLHKPITH